MKKLVNILMLLGVFILLTSESECNTEAVSTSGVSKKSTKVNTDLNGNTIEQSNIIARLKADNQPGSIKHLYVISAYSGEVILYSTVKGKVTSSGKRLSPNTIVTTGGNGAFSVDFGPSGTKYTEEVLSDDGAYGSSQEYLYWWDSRGIYHQHYVTGGAMLHISNEPLAVKKITINLELNTKSE